MLFVCTANRQGSELGIGRLRSRSRENVPEKRNHSANRSNGKAVSFSVADFQDDADGYRRSDIRKRGSAVPRSYQSADSLLSSTRWPNKHDTFASSDSSLDLGASEESSLYLDRRFSSTESVQLESSHKSVPALNVRDLSADELLTVNRLVSKKSGANYRAGLSSSAKELSTSVKPSSSGSRVANYTTDLTGGDDFWNLTDSIKLSEFCQSSLEDLNMEATDYIPRRSDDATTSKRKSSKQKSKPSTLPQYGALNSRAHSNLMNLEDEILKSCSEIISDLDARTAEISSLVTANSEPASNSVVTETANASVSQRMTRKDRPRKSNKPPTPVKSSQGDVSIPSPPAVIQANNINRPEVSSYSNLPRAYQTRGYPVEIVPLRDGSPGMLDPYDPRHTVPNDENTLNTGILLSSQKNGKKSEAPKKETKKKSSLKNSNVSTDSSDVDRGRQALSHTDHDSGVELVGNVSDQFNISMSSVEDMKKKASKKEQEKAKKEKKLSTKGSKDDVSKSKTLPKSNDSLVSEKIAKEKATELSALSTSPGSRRRRVPPVTEEWNSIANENPFISVPAKAPDADVYSNNTASQRSPKKSKKDKENRAIADGQLTDNSQGAYIAEWNSAPNYTASQADIEFIDATPVKKPHKSKHAEKPKSSVSTGVLNQQQETVPNQVAVKKVKKKKTASEDSLSVLVAVVMTDLDAALAATSSHVTQAKPSQVTSNLGDPSDQTVSEPTTLERKTASKAREKKSPSTTNVTTIPNIEAQMTRIVTNQPLATAMTPTTAKESSRETKDSIETSVNDRALIPEKQTIGLVGIKLSSTTVPISPSYEAPQDPTGSLEKKHRKKKTAEKDEQFSSMQTTIQKDVQGPTKVSVEIRGEVTQTTVNDDTPSSSPEGTTKKKKKTKTKQQSAESVELPSNIAKPSVSVAPLSEESSSKGTKKSSKSPKTEKKKDSIKTTVTISTVPAISESQIDDLAPVDCFVEEATSSESLSDVVSRNTKYNQKSDRDDANRYERATSLPPQSRRNLSLYRPASGNPSSSIRHACSGDLKTFRPSVKKLTKTKLVASLPELHLHCDQSEGVQRRAFSKIVEIIKMFTVTEETRPRYENISSSSENAEKVFKVNGASDPIVVGLPFKNDFVLDVAARISHGDVDYTKYSSYQESLEIARPAKAASKELTSLSGTCSEEQPSDYSSSDLPADTSDQESPPEDNVMDAFDKTLEFICEMLEVARVDHKAGATAGNEQPGTQEEDANELSSLECHNEEEGLFDAVAFRINTSNNLGESGGKSTSSSCDIPDSGYYDDAAALSAMHIPNPEAISLVKEYKPVFRSEQPLVVSKFTLATASEDDSATSSLQEQHPSLLEAVITDTYELRNYRLRVYERREPSEATLEQQMKLKRHSWNSDSKVDQAIRVQEFHPDLPIDIFDAESDKLI